ECAPGDGHRDRVRHLGRGPAPGQPDGGLLPRRQRLRDVDVAGAPCPLGLR
ncbi:MAG: Pup ligase PafA' paralog, possible component of postulated heterodimer PafA-PafA', partial [uncultured Nocardioidaceae bacterium]